MIMYEDRNRVGRDAAEEVFTKLVSTTPPATSIERASYLYGMQTFCRHQLKRELTLALDALESGVFASDKHPFQGVRPRPIQATSH